MLKMKSFTIATTVCAMAIASAASASILTTYQLPNYGGRHQQIDGCGCQGFRFDGSYKWNGTGQEGRLFRFRNCLDDVQATLPGDQELSEPSTFYSNSIDIVC
ncbi:hypothetical protein EDD11_003352 [Mortierella claussenii]|nr:hypothetical protein EDD11_003352 [Mortierella claussenii]